MKTFSRLVTALLFSILPGQLVAGEPEAAEKGGLRSSVEPPPINVTTRRADDRVEVVLASGRALVTVHSPRGIGGAALQRRGEAWPAKIVVRLYLRGLESFGVSNGKLKLSASVLSHSGHKRLLHLWEEGKQRKVEPASPYWTQLGIFDVRGKPIEKLPEQGGYFEIPLPKALLRGRPETLTLDWIDFYRG